MHISHHPLLHNVQCFATLYYLLLVRYIFLWQLSYSCYWDVNSLLVPPKGDQLLTPSSL